MGFDLPRLTKCCYCVPLRPATLIIGYVAIVTSVITLAAVSFFSFQVSKYVKETIKNSTENITTAHTPEEIQSKATWLYVTFAFYMLVFLYNLVINVMLVVGVHKNIPKYMTWYIKTAYCLLALSIVLIALTSVFMGLFATIGVLKWAFIVMMSLVIVKSTYLEMDEKINPRTIEMKDLYMPQQAPLMA